MTVKTVRRFDSGTTTSARILPNGWMRTEGTFTRAGIFNYRQPDGSIRREFRPPEEVFKKDSLATLEMVPVTDKHPPEEILDADNTKERAVGSVGNDIRVDGDFVRGSILVTDGDVVAKAQAGEQAELSCGYNCRIDATPGEWRGMKYDVVQKDITYNHVAVVKLARGGSELKLRLDSEDAVMVGAVGQASEPQPHRPDNQGAKTVKLKLDAKEVEVADEVAPTVIAYQTKMDSKVEELSKSLVAAAKERDEAKARADAADAEKAKAEQARKDAADPSKVAAAVKARRELERKASLVLGDDTEVKVDELDDSALLAAVVGEAFPEIKLDGKSDAYVTALFDAAVARADSEEGEEGLARVRSAVESKNDEGEEGEEGEEAEKPAKRLDADEARERFLAEQQNAWKKPLTASKK